MKYLSWGSLVLLISTLICGLWMKFASGPKDVQFHARLSTIAVLLSIVTIIFYLLKK